MGARMKRFVEGVDRGQATLFPESLDEFVAEDNSVRVIDVFVDELDLGTLGFDRVEPMLTGRPSYHPSVLLKLYVYGYLNRVQSSRRLEREAGRNVEVMWLTGRLVPDHKTIANFRKDNGPAIRRICARFVELCRTIGLFGEPSVAIDGSKFKAVNNRDRNFTRAKMQRRMAQIEESVARYLHQLDSADRQDRSPALENKVARLTEKIAKLKHEMRRLEALDEEMLDTPDRQISLTVPDARSMATSGRGSGVVGYNVQTSVDTTHHLIVAHDGHGLRARATGSHGEADEGGAGDGNARCGRRPGLFQQRGNPGLCRGGHHSDAAQANDIGQQIQGPFRQTGLP